MTDPSGAILPNVQVTIKNLGTGITRTMATTATGSYTFTLLPIGSYSVTVEASGFKTFTVPTLTLAAGDRARVDAKLEIGNISETVEVSAESAGALQTDSATVGGLVTSKAVQDLPLSGRNFMMLVQLVPGGNEGSENSLAGGTRPDDRRQTSAVSVNGMGDSVNNYLIDGLDNNERLVGTIGVKPSIDALAEVKVQTNLYSAEVGRTAGAVINMLTKSGTNEFHGTAFEFLRNDVFGAKDFFNVPQAGNPLAGVKPKYRQNQFGGSIGGPIIKNRTFFFGDYEGLRIVQGKTGTVGDPTACMLGRAMCNGVQQLGNFSELLPNTVIYDVTKNPITPFPGNIIPPERINSISKNYAAMMPTVSSGCTGGLCNFIGNPTKTQTADTFDVRVDHQLSKSDMLYGRYSFNNTISFVPGLLPTVDVAGVTVGPGGVAGQVLYPGHTNQRQQQMGVGYTHTFSPTLLLQANFGLQRSRTETLPLNWGVDVNKAFGGPDVNISEETSGLANIYFQDGGYGSPSGSSGGGLGDNMWLPLRYWDWVYQGNANLTWVHGAHSFKFGGNIVNRRVDNFQSRWAKGQFTFSSRQTNSTAGGAGGSGGNSFASFLLGYIYDERRELLVVTQRFRMWEYGAYAQDDWRATPWLTLNLGLRYDIYMPWTDADNNLSTFDPANSKMLDGGQVVVAGTQGFSNSFVDAEFNHFQPRVGFAASLGSGFVFRGGFGMSYYMTQANSPSTMRNQPLVSNWVASTKLGQPGTTPLVFGQGVPAPGPSSTCLTAACGNTSAVSVPQAYALDHKDARVYQFNLTLEKEFRGNVMSVGYVGNKAQNMNRVISNGNLPEPPKTAGGCGVTTTITLPNPCQPYYSKIPLVQSITNLNRHDGKLNYNGMQAIFTRRFSQGLTATSSYTWGKSLSNTGTPAGGCSGCSLWLSQWETYDYGSSANDIRQRFTFTANYQLPFGQSLSGFAGQVAKGWQINGLFAYTTGQRLTVTNGRPQINNGATSDRPNGLPQPENFNRTIEQWFDTTEFALQPYGTPGNLGRGTLQGPPQRRVDLSVFKDFPIREGVKLQFRVETFNMTNTPSFATPGTSISGWTSTDPATARPTQAGNFGRITSTSQFYTPRDFQFALKLIF